MPTYSMKQKKITDVKLKVQSTNSVHVTSQGYAWKVISNPHTRQQIKSDFWLTLALDSSIAPVLWTTLTAISSTKIRSALALPIKLRRICKIMIQHLLIAIDFYNDFKC